MFICDLLFLQYVFTFTAGKIANSIAHQRNTLRNPKTSSCSYFELELFFFVKKFNSILRPNPFKLKLGLFLNDRSWRTYHELILSLTNTVTVQLTQKGIQMKKLKM
jgi:hypothetical protein